MVTWLPALIILTIFRLISAGLFFFTPFAAGLTSIFLDSIDGNILFFYEMPRDIYQNYDKILDLITYITLFWIGIKTPIKKYVKITFLYRLIGQILFFFVQNHALFFFFPNFLEFPLITFFGFKKYGKKEWFLKNRTWIYLFWGINKLWMEYSIHVISFNWVGFFCGLVGLE